MMGSIQGIITIVMDDGRIFQRTVTKPAMMGEGAIDALFFFLRMRVDDLEEEVKETTQENR